MMRRICTMFVWLGLLGCAGSTDLGYADPSPQVPGKAGKLRSFAPVPGGMCSVFEGGQTYCWGGQGSTRAERVTNLDGIAMSAWGGGHGVCVIRTDGTLACASDPETPLQAQLGVEDAVDVSVGGGELAVLGRDGTISHRFREGCDGRGEPRPIQLESPAVEVRCADEGCCAATEDGRLFCFAGNRTDACEVQFTEVPGIEDAVGVSMTMEGACVLHANGKVSCSSGMLDPVTFLPDLTHFEAMAASNIVQLRSSRVATCGLTQSGALLCWGISQCGALGISENCGSTVVASPIAVQQDIETRLFGMQDGYTCSLDANDDVWCWGLSAWVGTAKGSPIPRRIEF